MARKDETRVTSHKEWTKVAMFRTEDDAIQLSNLETLLHCVTVHVPRQTTPFLRAAEPTNQSNMIIK